MPSRLLRCADASDGSTPGVEVAAGGSACPHEGPAGAQSHAGAAAAAALGAASVWWQRHAAAAISAGWGASEPSTPTALVVANTSAAAGGPASSATAGGCAWAGAGAARRVPRTALLTRREEARLAPRPRPPRTDRTVRGSSASIGTATSSSFSGWWALVTAKTTGEGANSAACGVAVAPPAPTAPPASARDARQPPRHEGILYHCSDRPGGHSGGPRAKFRGLSANLQQGST